MTAQQVVSQTVNAILACDSPHPVRVGIDGASASGKTNFADRLVQPLRDRGRHVIRASIDGFHNPPEIRYRQGESCPIGYVDDSFDKGSVIENLLHPLGPDGQRLYRESLYDFVSNRETKVEIAEAKPDSILIFEGVMLFCDTLAPHFDFGIFVHADVETIMDRALQRDSKRLGGREATIEKYQKRYIPGQQEYFRRHAPREQANLVIDNNDYLRPKIITRSKK